MLHKHQQGWRLFFRSIAMLLCLGAFALGQFQQSIRHQLKHSHEQGEHHSPKLEADACHVSIFHAGAANACDHPVHMSQDRQECDWCDSFLYSFWSLLEVSFNDIPVAIAEQAFYSVPFVQPISWERTRNRAPPMV